MTKRPLSVSTISYLFVAAGAIAVISQQVGLKALHPFPYDLLWASLVDLIAIAGGIYMLLGPNWARWLALLWMGFHVVLSSFHAWNEFVIHGLLFAAIAYVLFRPEASEYFRRKRLV